MPDSDACRTQLPGYRYTLNSLKVLQVRSVRIRTVFSNSVSPFPVHLTLEIIRRDVE